MKTKITSSCPICNSNNINEILCLPNLPVTELLYDSSQDIQFEITKADQKLLFCEKCSHGFLGTIVAPEYLYNSANYNTITSKSKGAQISIDNFASFIANNIDTLGYCIDVGGNDSSLMQKIEATSGAILDPNCKVSEDSPYQALNRFYESVEPDELTNEEITIVSSHTLEHIESPNQFFKFLKSIKNLNNVFSQFPCIELMSEASRYDLVHNQHLHYYSLASISKIASDYGFFLIDYEYDIDHYGTLRVYISKDKNKSKSIYESKQINISIISLIDSAKTFKLNCNATNSLLEQINNLYCYGASLMLPLIFYHHPKLKKSKCIFDSDLNKSKLKYANINTPISHDNGEIDLTEFNIFITAVSTRNAHRAIYRNLLKRNPRYLLSPFGAF